MRNFLPIMFAVALAACQPATEEANDAPVPETNTSNPAEAPAPDSTLADSLAAQPEEIQARYQYRHPQETLEFFGIEPGMTVVEGLPGAGWYTKVLASYLGADGHIIAIDYSMDIWPHFFFGTEEFIEERSTWTTDFVADAEEWRSESSASISAYRFGSVSEDVAGTADVVFFPRVLHNLANHQNAGNGQYLDIALADVYTLLKPGGVFGVVQHRARDDMSDAFADGTHGYLKQSFVIEQAEAAGLVYVSESDINANANDQPGEDDIVWRLPPTYFDTAEDPELKAAVDAIGESHRMTLMFKKPE